MTEKTCKFITFGCKVNQYETQAMKEDLEGRGYRTAEEGEPVDLVVVNTCTVTHKSDRKARKAIRRATREHADSSVVVVGCYAENTPEDIRSIEGVDRVFSHNNKARLGELLEEENTSPNGPDPAGMVQQSVSGLDRHTRAWLKIEDGCNLFCNFCIIPYVRGRPRSKQPSDVLSEVEELAEQGYKEIVLTGIHVGCYGQDLKEDQQLPDLIRAIGKQNAVPRVRLSSIEADEMDRELLNALRDAPNVVPHLHMPLQSGSDFILKRMNRRYNVEEFREKVELVREAFDRPAISTDVIVGFPGETTADFHETLALCREIGFSKIHVFSYSDREGTKAADMEPKVPDKVQNRRVDQLERLETVLQKQYKEQFIGEQVDVLVETYARAEDDLLQGYSPRYMRTRFRGAERLTNQIVTVEVTDVRDRVGVGRLVAADVA